MKYRIYCFTIILIICFVCLFVFANKCLLSNESPDKSKQSCEFKQTIFNYTNKIKIQEYIKPKLSPYVDYGEMNDIVNLCMNTKYKTLLLSLALVESSFNPKAINLTNKKGYHVLWLMTHGKLIPKHLIPTTKQIAIGIFQIKPYFWCKKEITKKGIKFNPMEVRELFNYKSNVKIASKILDQYVKSTGDIFKALEKFQGKKPSRVLKVYGELTLLGIK